MNTYRASRHVRLGVPDEHSYSLFLSFENICNRLGLWESSVHWSKVQGAFHRLTQDMKNNHIKTKRHVQELLQKESPYAARDADKVPPAGQA